MTNLTKRKKSKKAAAVVATTGAGGAVVAKPKPPPPSADAVAAKKAAKRRKAAEKRKRKRRVAAGEEEEEEEEDKKKKTSARKKRKRNGSIAMNSGEEMPKRRRPKGGQFLDDNDSDGNDDNIDGDVVHLAEGTDSDDNVDVCLDEKKPVTPKGSKRRSSGGATPKMDSDNDEDDDSCDDDRGGGGSSKRQSRFKRKQRKPKKKRKGLEEEAQQQQEHNDDDEEEEDHDDDEEEDDHEDEDVENADGEDGGEGLWLPTRDIPEWALSQLDGELHQFANFVRLNPPEVASRQRVIDHVERLARDLFGSHKFSSRKRAFVEDGDPSPPSGLQVVTFGSFATPDVCTFGSDVDLAIWGVVDPPPSTTTTTKPEEETVVSEPNTFQDDHEDVEIVELSKRMPAKNQAFATPTGNPPQVFVLDCEGEGDDNNNSNREKEQEDKEAGPTNEWRNGLPPLSVISAVKEEFFLEDVINRNGISAVSPPPSPCRPWSSFAAASAPPKGTTPVVSSSSLSSEEGGGTAKSHCSLLDPTAAVPTTSQKLETETTKEVAVSTEDEDETMEVHEVINMTAASDDDESDVIVVEDEAAAAAAAMIHVCNDKKDDDDDDTDSADKMESFHAKKKSMREASSSGVVVADDKTAPQSSEPPPPDDNQEDANFLVNLASSPSSSEDEAYVARPRKRSRSLSVEAEMELVRAWQEEAEDEDEEDAIEVSCVASNDDDDDEEDTATPTMAVGPRGKTRTRVIAALQALGKRLRASPMTRRLEVRCKARVPIICIRTNYGFETDIALGGHSGADTSQYAGLQVQRFQSFAPVVLFLKILLQQNDLDKPFTGGLGSYKLYVLVAHHMERHLQCGGSDRPSEILLSFFYRFGQTRKELRQRRRRRRHAITMLHPQTEISCRTGGKAEMGAVYKLDDCIGLFRACFQQVGMPTHLSSSSSSLLSGLIQVECLDKARKTSCQRALCSLSLSLSRGGATPAPKKSPLHKKGRRNSTGGTPEYATPQQRCTSRVGALGRGRRHRRPTVVGTGAAQRGRPVDQESAVLHRALKRRGSKKKQQRDAALREYAQGMLLT